MTPSVRRRIYTIAGAVLTVMVLLGFITEGDAPLWLAVVDAVLALVVAGLALFNLNADTWATFRLAVYGLVAAAGPALATVGVRLDERWPLIITQLLTIATAVLAVQNIQDDAAPQPNTPLPPP